MCSTRTRVSMAHAGERKAAMLHTLRVGDVVASLAVSFTAESVARMRADKVKVSPTTSPRHPPSSSHWEQHSTRDIRKGAGACEMEQARGSTNPHEPWCISPGGIECGCSQRLSRTSLKCARSGCELERGDKTGTTVTAAPELMTRALVERGKRKRARPMLGSPGFSRKARRTPSPLASPPAGGAMAACRHNTP
jgi:hypothetical protein